MNTVEAGRFCEAILKGKGLDVRDLSLAQVDALSKLKISTDMETANMLRMVCLGRSEFAYKAAA